MGTSNVDVKDGVETLQSRIRLTEIIHQESVAICRPFVVDPAIGRLLADVIWESLLHRGGEWISRGVQLEKVSEKEIFLLIRPSIAAVLSKAKSVVENEGRDHVLLVDVLAAIAERWCHVWPMCK